MSEGKIKVAGFAKDSIVDGPGLRFTLFTQGCPHNCKGCHNKDTHDFNGGKEYSVDEIFNEILQDKGISGVTFSGGEPFCQAEKLLPLAKKIKEKGFELAIYSGFTFEELFNIKLPYVKDLLKEADILIDGRFKIEEKSLDISFRGSKNQRILDVKKSLMSERAVWTNSMQWLYKELAPKDEYAPKDIKAMGW